MTKNNDEFDKMPIVDEQEMIDHIEDELLKAGYAPDREAIQAVLEAEVDFLEKKGLIIYEDHEEINIRFDDE